MKDFQRFNEIRTKDEFYAAIIQIMRQQKNQDLLLIPKEFWYNFVDEEPLLLQEFIYGKETMISTNKIMQQTTFLEDLEIPHNVLIQLELMK